MARSEASVPVSEAATPSVRHQQILDAAARIFFLKGFDATSIQDIADEVGMLKGSLYHYIDTKEDLLVALIEEFNSVATQNLQEWLAVEGDSLARLRVFIHGLVVQTCQRHERAALFHHEFRALSKERRAKVIESRHVYERTLRELIVTGQDEGSICPDIEPKMAAMWLLGMVNSLYQWYRPDGAMSPDELAQGCADMVIAALHCSPATHRPGHRSALGGGPVVDSGDQRAPTRSRRPRRRTQG